MEGLEHFIEQVTGESHLRVEDDLGDGFVRLRVSEAERRQAQHDIRSSEDIVIEMLRNARDASAHNVFVATNKEGDHRRLTIIDDGSGIPRHMWTHVFEARVTSKLDSVHMDTWGIHGRGMALFAVQSNCQAAYVADSVLGGGTSFVVEVDTSSLREKTDQSSKPQFVRTESGSISVRGPKNIVRTVTEFAYIDQSSIDVYLGSPIDIAATLWQFGRLTQSAAALAFCEDPSQLPLCKRLAASSSPAEFVYLANGIGLELSERSARRAMDGEIDPLPSIADEIKVAISGAEERHHRLAGASNDAVSSPNEAMRKRVLASPAQTVRFGKDDLKSFSAKVSQAFEELSEVYYLDSSVAPKVTLKNGEIHVVIPIVNKG